MISKDYEALRGLLEEFRREAAQLDAQIDDTARKIREFFRQAAQLFHRSLILLLRPLRPGRDILPLAAQDVLQGSHPSLQGLPLLGQLSAARRDRSVGRGPGRNGMPGQDVRLCRGE